MVLFQKFNIQSCIFTLGISLIFCLFVSLGEANFSDKLFTENLNFTENSEIVQNEAQLNPKKKAILIMALYRGGSTLAGEVFNKDSNMKIDLNHLAFN